MIQIVPSILSVDFTRLGDQVAEADAAGADRFQVDVMDGHFVPNISFGPMVTAATRRSTRRPIEAHLMIENPERYVSAFADAGADFIIVHAEATVHLHRLVQQIKGLGRKAGVALNPATPTVVLEEIISDLDLVLAMTVNPGFGGQDFIASTLPKIRRVRRMIAERGLHCDLEVDGGIHAGTVGQVVTAGADVLVAGSSVYGHPQGIATAIEELRRKAEMVLSI